MNSLKTFIIIVTYNGISWIDECLWSCKGYPVIIVDNASTDDTVLFIKSNYPDVILLEQSKNLGFGAANNIGIKYALNIGADYVFLLNQDAYLEKGTLEKLVQAHKKQPDYGVLSPIHLNGTGDKLDYNFSLYITPNRCKGLYSDFCLQSVKSDLYEVGFVNAAAWLISKKCLEMVGGFNPSFFHYGEDDNYIQRVKYYNLKVGVLANTFIRHDRGNKKHNVYFENNRLVYQRNLIMRYSDPTCVNSFNNEYFKLLKTALKNLLLLNYKPFKKTLIKLSVLNSLNRRYIINNREISRNESGAFLTEFKSH